MVDTEAKKILEGLWADSGDRLNPDDASLTPILSRDTGWTSPFSATDGDVPRRRVMNQRFRELDGVASDTMREGLLAWDTDIDYRADAIVQAGSKLWRATVATGPDTSNATDPTAVGQTVWSEVAGQMNVPSAPPTPTASAGNGVLDWVWGCPLDNGARVSEFDFQWRVQGGSYSVSITVSVAAHELTGLSNGTTYEVRVRATNSVGTGLWSSVGTGTPAAESPGQVFGVDAEGGDGEVDVSWTEPDNGGDAIIRYEVQWRTGLQSFSTGRQTTNTDAMVTVGSLTNGTEYFFRVRAVNLAGNGDWSSVVSSTPAMALPAVSAPDAPDAPVAVVGQGELLWSWNCPRDNGGEVTSFDFQQREQGDSWPMTSVQVMRPVRVGSSLTNGTEYEVRVRATNSAGTSGWSATASGTPAAEVPDGVQHVEVDAGNGQLVLDWGEPESNGAAISGYAIQRATNSGFSANVVNATSGASTSALTITGLTNGTTYYVRVRAVNSAGNGAWSPGVSGAPDSGVSVPDAPSGMAGVAVRPLRIRWEWEIPSDNGARITEFDLQWRVSGNAWSGNIVSVDSGFYLLSGLSASNSYQARVRASNSAGDGGWSSTGTVASGDMLAPVTQMHRFTSSQSWTWPYSDVTRATIILKGGDGGSGGGGGSGSQGDTAGNTGGNGGTGGGGGDGGRGGSRGKGADGSGTFGGPGGTGGGGSTFFSVGAGANGGPNSGGGGGGGSTTLRRGGGGGEGATAGDDTTVAVGGSTYTADNGNGGGGGGGGGASNIQNGGGSGPIGLGGGIGGAPAGGTVGASGRGGAGASGASGQTITETITGLSSSSSFTITIGDGGSAGNGGGGGGTNGNDGSAGADGDDGWVEIYPQA